MTPIHRLYGVTSLQTFIYFTRGFAADNRFVKYLVFFLWVLNTLRLAIISHAAYTYLVTDFLNVVAILKPTWSMFPAAVVTVGVNNAVVRGVFCYRVWRFSGDNMWLATAISLAILVTLGTNFAYSVIAHRLPTWYSLDEYSWLLTLSFAWSMVADILICVSLCFLLAKRRTGYARSDTVVRKLTLYAINTGLLSTLCAVLCLAAYLTMPDNFIFMALYIIYPELILNSLLATFNGRSSLQSKMTSAPAVQHAALDSARGRRGAHVTKDVNLVELGAVSHSTSQGSDMCVVIQRDEADKIPEYNA